MTEFEIAYVDVLEDKKCEKCGRELEEGKVMYFVEANNSVSHWCWKCGHKATGRM